MIRCCLTVLAVVSLAITGLANWTQHRADARLSGALTTQPSLWTNTIHLFKRMSLGAPSKGSPSINKSGIYIGNESGELIAFNHDGTVRWRFKTDVGIESTPLLINKQVVFGSGDFGVYCLDQVSGKLVWTYETDGKVLASPILFEEAEFKAIVIGSYDGTMYALSPTDGTIIWKYKTENYINSTPAVHDGLLVVGSCDASLHAIDGKTGEGVWQHKVDGPIAGSCAISQDLAIVGHYRHQVLGVNLSTGQRQWTYQDKPFGYFSSPALDDTVAIIGGRDKHLHAIVIKSGKKQWATPVRGRVDSSPVIIGNHVMAATTRGRIILLNKADGKILATYEAGAGIVGSPAVYQDKVYLPTQRGDLLILSPTPPAKEDRS